VVEHQHKVIERIRARHAFVRYGNREVHWAIVTAVLRIVTPAIGCGDGLGRQAGDGAWPTVRAIERTLDAPAARRGSPVALALVEADSPASQGHGNRPAGHLQEAPMRGAGQVTDGYFPDPHRNLHEYTPPRYQFSTFFRGQICRIAAA
jgi:hypothetical protein